MVTGTGSHRRSHDAEIVPFQAVHHQRSQRRSSSELSKPTNMTARGVVFLAVLNCKFYQSQLTTVRHSLNLKCVLEARTRRARFELINATQIPRPWTPYSNEGRQDNELGRCFSGGC